MLDKGIVSNEFIQGFHKVYECVVCPTPQYTVVAEDE